MQEPGSSKPRDRRAHRRMGHSAMCQAQRLFVRAGSACRGAPQASGRVNRPDLSTPRDPWRFIRGRGILLCMTSRARKILEEALTLPEEDRLYLAEALQESVETVESQEEVDAAWRQEIVRRVRSIKDGSAVLHSLDDVERELSQILEEG
jgi:putative addiction module component (TIGR02574 family)